MIMMSTKCKFCIASLPFYKRMMEEQNEKDGLVHFVAAFPNSSEEVIQFVTENQFPIETVAGLKFDDVGLQYTPTLVLIDNRGKVLNAWVGQLTPEGEKNVF